MSDVSARTQFTDFKERTEPIADTELDAWWSTLEPARIEDMIGEWPAASSPPDTK